MPNKIRNLLIIVGTFVVYFLIAICIPRFIDNTLLQAIIVGFLAAVACWVVNKLIKKK